MGGISAYHCSIFRLPSRGETREESKGVIRGYTREINAIHSPTPSPPPPPRATHYSTSPPFHTAFDVRSRTSWLPQLFLLNFSNATISKNTMENGGFINALIFEDVFKATLSDKSDY